MAYELGTTFSSNPEVFQDHFNFLTKISVHGVSEKSSPIKLFRIFSLLREILQIYWQFISTYIC